MPLLEVHNGPLCERMTCLYTPDVSPDPIIYLYAFFLFFFRTPRRPGLARRKKKNAGLLSVYLSPRSDLSMKFYGQKVAYGALFCYSDYSVVVRKK